MMGFGLIWFVLLAFVVAYVLGWRPESLRFDGPYRQRDEATPLEILRERYARGEVKRDEFERMRADLER